MKSIIVVPNLEFIHSESQLFDRNSIISSQQNFHSQEETKKLNYKNSLKSDQVSEFQFQDAFSNNNSELFSERFIANSTSIQPVQIINYPDEPVQLLKINSKNQFELCESGLKILGSIKNSVAIVTFSGLHHTGKSFLLNLLLNKFNSGVFFFSFKLHLVLIPVLGGFGFGEFLKKFKIKMLILFLLILRE